MSNPKLNLKEESSAKKTRSPPKKAKVEQSVPRKKKLKTDAEKTAEKAQHLRFGKAELTPDELSRLSKAQKREMYAAHAARSAVHREVDPYEDDNVGTQALSEGEKAAGNVRDISKSRYARKLKKKAKMQGKKGAKTAKSSVQKPTSAQDAGASGTGEGGSNWLSRWRKSKTSGRAIMPPPGPARRRRPQVVRRHPTVHLPPGPAWNRRWRKAKLPSAPP